MRKSTILKSLFTLIVLVSTIGVGDGVTASSPITDRGLSVIQTDGGLHIVWQAPRPDISNDSDGNTLLQLPGFTQVEIPGAARLPMGHALIALPPDAQPTLQVISLDESLEPLPGNLALAPEPKGILYDDLGEIIGGAYERVEQPVDFFPEVIEIEYIGVMRGVNLARLSFYPVRFEGESLRVTTRIEVKLDFNTTARMQGESETIEDPFRKAIQSAVINPQQIQSEERVDIPLGPDIKAALATSSVAIIEVEQRGITEVSYENLNSAGFPVNSVNPQNLHLYHANEEVAFEWNGGSSFNPGESFYFYANPRVSRWTYMDSYLLQEETSTGARIQSRSANPDGLSLGNATIEKMFEENLRYNSDDQNGRLPDGWDGDHWVWHIFKISDANKRDRSYGIQLPEVNGTQSGTLTLWLIGYTDLFQAPDHRVNPFVNGTSLIPPTFEWNGKQLVEANFHIPAGALENGANTVRIYMPGINGINIEGMYLDAFKIEYVYDNNEIIIDNSLFFSGEATQHAYKLRLNDDSNVRVYDVSNPNTPLLLTNIDELDNYRTIGDPTGGGVHEYMIGAADGIYTPTNIRLREEWNVSEAEYILITHSDFRSQLSPLITLRENQGMSVSVVDVQTIYDNYDDGRPTPDAIKAFLSDAYQTWSIQQPFFVLLVGDGTDDPKHFITSSTNTYIPPYLEIVDPWAGETAADNRYVTMDGVDDILPDMMLGRLPVNSVEETQRVVDKIVEYETNLPGGEWLERVTFVADNPDIGNNFPHEADNLADNWIPSNYQVDKIYHSEGTSGSTTRNQIIQNWNAGTSLITYIGHSAPNRWASEPIFHMDDIYSLSNGSKLPVVLELTCFTGKFQWRAGGILDESFLRYQNGGAVAVIGGTGYGLSSGHKYLAEGFFDAIFYQNKTQLGQAFLEGKLVLATYSPQFVDLLDTYLLFGDPATMISLAGFNFIYLPFITR